ncbi:hypothetical protein, partial [Gordonia terrae]
MFEATVGAGPVQQLLVAGSRGGEFEIGQRQAEGVDDRCVVGLLMGINPEYDHLRTHCCLGHSGGVSFTAVMDDLAGAGGHDSE